ncbi:MAG TPA: rhizosphere induced protein RhiB [Betaproteobacteria bacterium]|nr:rhizosphere induced protein RhiB [Betaproteobacteria bacterium]
MIAAAAGLPVGTVLPYAAPVNNAQAVGSGYPNPESRAYDLHLEQCGWLVCDGRPVAVARYPELFRVIGGLYGKDSSGKFLLPDYRGRFLRGVNGDAQGPDQLLRDPQAAQRDPSGAGGWSGNQTGSVQEDALQAHAHHYQKAIAAGTAAEGSPVFGADETPDPQTTGMAAPTDYQPAITVRKAPETRVKNVYVNFIIRFTQRPVAIDFPGGRFVSALDDIGVWLP